VNVVTHDFHLFKNAKQQTAASQSLKATASAAVDSELSGCFVSLFMGYVLTAVVGAHCVQLSSGQI
jgi:hypothetical protein